MTLTAILAISCWAASIWANGNLGIEWPAGLSGQLAFDSPDDPGNGPEGFKTEGRSLDFFMSVSICTMFLKRCFPDAN